MNVSLPSKQAFPKSINSQTLTLSRQRRCRGFLTKEELLGAGSCHPHPQNLVNRMNEPTHLLWFKYYWPGFCSGVPHSPRWEVTEGVHRLGTALGLEPAHLTRRDNGRARHAGPAQSPLLPPHRSQQPRGRSRDARRVPRSPAQRSNQRLHPTP